MYQIKPLEVQYNQIIYSFLSKNLHEGKISSLKEEIEELFAKKTSEIKNCLVKVFFLGAVNSGKSTLINSIVGKSILPTGNQNKPQNFITLTNSINEKFFTYVLKDSEMFTDNPIQIREAVQDGEIICQFKEQLRMTNIQLIDTPGFRFDDDENNQAVIDEISNLCQGNVVPIFVMVINQLQNKEYLEVIELLQKIKFQQRHESIMSSFKSLMKGLENHIQLEQKNTVIVINKYDKMECNLQDNQTFQTISQIQQLFRISALYAFYNSVFRDQNHISYKKLVSEFFYMHKKQFNLSNENQAVQFINQNILNNQQQSFNYDYDLFLNQLNLIIKYEYNRKLFNETHHQLQSKLCVLDQVQQGYNFDESIEFVQQMKGLYDQIEQNMQTLVQETFSLANLITKREEYYNNFIQQLNDPNKHSLKKNLSSYYNESMKFLLEQRKAIDDSYKKFTQESVNSLKQLVGHVQVSFELISSSSLNLPQQLELTISQVEKTLFENEDIDYVIKQIKSLENNIGLTDSTKNIKNTIISIFSLINKVSGRNGTFSELLYSTFDKINNEQIVDLRVIQENIHFTERQIIKIILDQKNQYIFVLQQIMIGCKTFMKNFEKGN